MKLINSFAAQSALVDGNDFARQQRLIEVTYGRSAGDPQRTIEDRCEARAKVLQVVVVAEDASFHVLDPLPDIADIGRYNRQVTGQSLFDDIRRTLVG